MEQWQTSLCCSVNILQLIRALRELHPSLYDMEGIVLTLLHNVLTSRSDDIITCQGVLSTLHTCLEHVENTLHAIQDCKPNYFGVFRFSVYLETVTTLGRKITECQTFLTGTMTPALHPTADSFITHSSSKLFWIKYFGTYLFDVPWNTFKEALVTEYGPQPASSLTQLQVTLLGSPTPSNSPSNNNVDAVLNIFDFDAFCCTCGGFYASFQQLVDPGKVVYIMGTLSSEGLSSSATRLYTPRILESLSGLNVSQLSCGGQHVAILTENGTVYTFGHGKYGRLGHGNEDVRTVPTRVHLLETTCVQVACGFAYTTAVTETGELYSWGAGENGRMGTGNEQNCLIPTKVRHFRDAAGNNACIQVEQVFAGSVHTCILSHSGAIYSCGRREYAGHGKGEDILLPTLLTAFEEKHVCQISIAPSGYHTLALTMCGHVYTWGQNRVGQLGYPNRFNTEEPVDGAHCFSTPQLVEDLVDELVVQVAAGWGHSACLTEKGDLFTCGRNQRGQLGLGEPSAFPVNDRGHVYQDKFVQVQDLMGKKVVQVACGGEHTVVLLENGNVYTMGSGKEGQLGQGGNGPTCVVPLPVTALRNTCRTILQIACGNECTLILAGRRSARSLYELCLDSITCHDEMYSTIMECGERVGIPSIIVDAIRSHRPWTQDLE